MAAAVRAASPVGSSSSSSDGADPVRLAASAALARAISASLPTIVSSFGSYLRASGTRSAGPRAGGSDGPGITWVVDGGTGSSALSSSSIAGGGVDWARRSSTSSSAGRVDCAERGSGSANGSNIAPSATRSDASTCEGRRSGGASARAGDSATAFALVTTSPAASASRGSAVGRTAGSFGCDSSKETSTLTVASRFSSRANIWPRPPRDPDFGAGSSLRSSSRGMAAMTVAPASSSSMRGGSDGDGAGDASGAEGDAGAGGAGGGRGTCENAFGGSGGGGLGRGGWGTVGGR